MIENLIKYLQTEIPAQTFILNNVNTSTPDNCIMVRQTGGTLTHWYDRQDFTVQFLGRNKDGHLGFIEINEVYNLLKNRIGLSLPEVTVGAITFPEVKTAQISPIQPPGGIGADHEGRYMYSFNITVTTK